MIGMNQWEYHVGSDSVLYALTSEDIAWYTMAVPIWHDYFAYERLHLQNLHDENRMAPGTARGRENGGEAASYMWNIVICS
jgi:hypothetical protein